MEYYIGMVSMLNLKFKQKTFLKDRLIYTLHVFSSYKETLGCMEPTSHFPEEVWDLFHTGDFLGIFSYRNFVLWESEG